MPHEFQLFPEDKEASPGDAVIQFLFDEQKKGNKRFKDVMESVFPGFGKAIDKVTGGSDKRAKQLNELFGLGLGEPITGEDVTELALGFGVGSIKSITGVPGLGVRLGGNEITRPRQFSVRGLKEKTKAREATEETGQDLQPIDFPTRVKPGTKPPAAFLEAQALKNQAKGATQTKVKKIQTGLNKELLEEVVSGGQPNLLRVIAEKGLRPTVKLNDETGSIEVDFESKGVAAHPEFTIIGKPDGHILKIDYNSKLIPAELEPSLKAALGNRYNSTSVTERQMTRMLEGQSRSEHTGEILLDDFDDGVLAINMIMDMLINAR